jgi:hypothetical protein
MLAQTLRRFELSSSVWEKDEMWRLMPGHLSAVVAWHKGISDDNPTTERSKGPPPPAPLTMFELIADAYPTYDGLRAMYIACAPQPADVVDAIHRRQRWHDHYE